VNVPSWVTQAVGIYAVLGSVFFVVLIVLVAYLLRVLADLSIQVRSLTDKVQKLTDRVQGIADQVNNVTSEVGSRTTGIVRMVDDSVGGAIRVLDMLAPVLLAVGAFYRLKQVVKRRR
jgi:predicted PurR-regulated permease PerM